MSQATQEVRVIPAQLDFLTLYNPSLSVSDDTLKDQIVFYHDHRARRRPKHHDGPASKDALSNEQDEQHEHDEQNRKLRQVGMAQGMVNFAKNFSDSNVDTIDTEKSRIVLHELEKDWWILASIDLTRLPTRKASQSPSTDTASAFEYSAREVAPASLLVTQLTRAHSIFLLHHASSLSELFARVGRDTFCSLLDRYWTQFVRRWDVLLHGNPATTIYDAVKLSGGGELGIGVGEEDYGSGEREVLEDFVDRTQGLTDLILGRYGLPPATERAKSTGNNDTKWLGTGNDPAAADGIVFSGKGRLSRHSLRTVSQWMEEIFSYGEDAYGVAQNPSSRPRQRRRKPKLERAPSSGETNEAQAVHPKRAASLKKQAPNLRRQAIENNAAPPGIPAPLVGQVERSLEDALTKAASSTSSTQNATNKNSQADQSSTFGTDNMMKYLSLGYGTAWTLNPKGLGKDKNTTDSKSGNSAKDGGQPKGTDTSDSGLQEVDPTPDVSEDEKPFQQKLEQSIGKFLIGLSGDLEQAELEADIDSGSEDVIPSPMPTQRLFLRTLNVQRAQPRQRERSATIREESYLSQIGDGNVSIGASPAEPKTSAAASIDGPQPNINFEKVQVAVYVHQPFIFVFMFELHTPSLTMPSFYRSIHNQLGPLQKPLLRSTDPSNIAARIAEAIGEKTTTSKTSSFPEESNPIYDLIYDPAKLTVRTSIPNIPLPGTLAAEGLTSNTSSFLSISGSWYTLGIPVGTTASTSTTTTRNPDKLTKSAWSRVEAISVHTQILNTHKSTRPTSTATRQSTTHEDTVKTARGWWIIWMKVKAPHTQKTNKHAPDAMSLTGSTSTTTGLDRPKEAFLVRKAADFRPTPAPRTISTGPGKWLLREQKRDTSGASSVGGSASAKGVSDGVGVDARRWVDGLLTLTQ